LVEEGCHTKPIFPQQEARLCYESESYTSDLTDEPGQILLPQLPVKRHGSGRPVELDLRQVANAILYLEQISS
jgi:hypothetical protein